MKQKLIIFLQILIMIIGISAFAFMLWEPHIEGRNVNSKVFEIYFNDPFLAYAYTASIFFFVALYQVFKILGYIRRNEVLSQTTMKALQVIKYCIIVLITFIVGAEAYLFIIQRSKDDIAGGVFMGLLIIIVSVVMLTAATIFERYLQSKLNEK